MLNVIARMSFFFAFVATMSVLATGVAVLVVFVDAGGNWSVVGWLALLTLVAGGGFAAADAMERRSAEAYVPTSGEEATGLPSDAGVFGQLWTDAHRKDPTVPAFGISPYWSSQGDGPPTLVSMIGLKGKAHRLEAATSPALDAIMRDLMKMDPDPDVRAAAMRYR